MAPAAGSWILAFGLCGAWLLRRRHAARERRERQHLFDLIRGMLSDRINNGLIGVQDLATRPIPNHPDAIAERRDALRIAIQDLSDTVRGLSPASVRKWAVKYGVSGNSRPQ
jgi:hypothetical protein